MLRQRVRTAVVLLAVVFAAVLATPSWPLQLLLGAMAACALWEWLRLTLPVRYGGIALGGACAFFVISCFLLFTPHGKLALFELSRVAALPLFGVVTLFWLVLATGAVIRGRPDIRASSGFYSMVSVVAVFAAWLALILLFAHRGAGFLVSLLALIWVADIAAYFSGKAMGRHKLAPRVSPGKTWEGAFGGVAGACLWVAISAGWQETFGYALVSQWGWPAAVAFAAALGAVSIVGDLFESLLKRRAGRKDSSGLLPGHGGVFDRIDALLPVAPLAFLLTGF